MKEDDVASAINAVFTSFDEENNVFDAVEEVGCAIRCLANAITPTAAAPWNTDCNGVVDSLTEAVIYLGQRIGNGLDSIAAAIAERNEV